MTLSKDGKGIVAALGQQKNMQRSALTHAVRSIYWLIKREIPHITTYTPLLELLELCECPHLIHLNKVLFLNRFIDLHRLFFVTIDTIMCVIRIKIIFK